MTIFLDLDGVVVRQGTREEFGPGCFDAVRRLTRDNDVYFFSCWAFTTDDCTWLSSQFPNSRGVIRKPLADRYAYIDDKLSLEHCANALLT